MYPFLYVVQPVFFSGGPVDSCHPGCLAGCFCNGVVSNGVAKSLRRFTAVNKGSCFPARESTCCLTF